MSCWCHMTNHHWRLLHWRPASINMRLWRGRRRWNCRPPMCRKRGIESWTPDRTLMPHTPIIFIVVWLQTGQFRNGHGRRRHVPEIFRGRQKVVNLIRVVELRRLISVSATPKLMMRTYVVMMLTVMISSAWNLRLKWVQNRSFQDFKAFGGWMFEMFDNYIYDIFTWILIHVNWKKVLDKMRWFGILQAFLYSQSKLLK